MTKKTVDELIEDIMNEPHYEEDTKCCVVSKRCIFCKTEETKVRYMLTKDDVCICDSCVILLGESLNKQLKKDNNEKLANLKNR